MKCLHESDVNWLDNPYRISETEVEPGMVVETEYGDFDHWVQEGVLVHGPSQKYSGSWYTYGVRVVRNDWDCLDEMYGNEWDEVLVVGYFDVETFLAENPDLDLSVH